MSTNDVNSHFVREILENLPKKRAGTRMFCQWEGFWYAPHLLAGLLAAQSHFQACPDDVILASSMKTGTTWLKAIIPSIMHFSGVDDDADPLIKDHPNALIPSLEIQVYNKGYISQDFLNATPPRLFRTHAPYAALPESIKKSDCKIVYITRNPKDTFVSLWHFLFSGQIPNQENPYPIDLAFDNYCNGIHPFGPFFDHVLEYWRASLKYPEKILFMKYEDKKKEPLVQVKKLASFLGKPFTNDEEAEKVLWRCSLDRLKNLEVNKNGLEPWVALPKSSYFRKGTVGDWKNCLTDEMIQRLDEISHMKLDGSGLRLDDQLENQHPESHVYLSVHNEIRMQGQCDDDALHLVPHRTDFAPSS